jgi:hypothetical protein
MVMVVVLELTVAFPDTMSKHTGRHDISVKKNLKLDSPAFTASPAHWRMACPGEEWEKWQSIVGNDNLNYILVATTRDILRSTQRHDT